LATHNYVEPLKHSKWLTEHVHWSESDYEFT